MNLPQLNNIIHYVTLMCYVNFLCFIYRIPYHFIHNINDYSGILYFHYILQITSYVYDLCFIYQFRYLFLHFSCLHILKKMNTEKNCMYPRVLSLYETVISICALLYDPNGVHVINQNRANYIYILQQLYP